MTWCAIINRTLCTDICPIPEGACTYRHRVTGQCKAQECQGLSGIELAEVVGVSMTDDQYNEIFNSLKEGLSHEEA